MYKGRKNTTKSTYTIVFLIAFFCLPVAVTFAAAVQNTNPTGDQSPALTGNIEVGELVWVNNVLQVRTRANGTGTVRPLQLTTGANTGIYVNTSGQIGIGRIPGSYALDISGTARGSIFRSEASSVNSDISAYLIQMMNARASAFAAISAKNSGSQYSVIMRRWDGVGTLEANCNLINSGWHAQAAIKGNYFNQTFDSVDFTDYSSIILDQATFDVYKANGTQWWVACSTLSAFSQSPNTLSTAATYVTPGVFGGLSTKGNYTFQAAANTNPVLFVDATNERVGIGTTSPNTLLHVAGDGLPTMTIEGADNTYGFYRPNYEFKRSRGSISGRTAVQNGDWLGNIRFAGFDGSSWGYGVDIVAGVDGVPGVAGSGQVPGSLAFLTTPVGSSASQYRMYISSTGNVGIGTTSPGSTTPIGLNAPNNVLEIKSPSNVNGLYLRRSDGLAGLDITNEGQSTGKVYFDSIYNNATVGYGGFQFRVKTSGTPVDAMRIDSNGNVGIGTTSPTQKLDVAGRVIVDNNYGYTQRASGGATVTVLNLTGGDNLNVGQSSTQNDMYLNVGSVASAVTIKATSGNVGIGTTNPGYKLDVAGDINTTGYIYQSGSLLSSMGAWTIVPVTPDWYTVGYLSTGRGYGEFTVENITSSQHQIIKFLASIQYGGGGQITVLQNSFFGTVPFSKIRLARLSADVTYGAYAVQVYGADLYGNATNNRVRLANTGNQGWAIKNFTTVENASYVATTAEVTLANSTINHSGNLVVNGSVTANGGFSGAMAGTLSAAYIGPAVFGATAGKGNYTFEAAANTNNVLKIDATNERVGIGTTSPGAKLDVAGSAYLNSQNQLFSSEGQLNGARFYTSAANQYARFGGLNDGGYNFNSALMSQNAYATYDGSWHWKRDDTAHESVALRLGMPRYSFGGSANSYFEVLYSGAGTGDITWSPGIVMNSSGNIGIGTTNPTENLQIGDGSGYAHLMLQSNGGGGYIKFNDSVNGTTQYIGHLNTTGAIQFAAGTTTPQMTFTTSGNLGIGTVSPGAKLDVNAGTSAAAKLTSTADYQLHLNSPDSWTGILFDDSGAVNDYIWYSGGTGTFAIGGGGSSGVPNKKLHVNGGVTIGANYSGTAVGANSLVVEGSVTANVGFIFPDATTQTTAYLGSSQTVSAGNVSQGVFGYPSGSNAYAFPAALAIGTTTYAGLPTNGLYVAGNVGIGTTNPQSQLEIANNGVASFDINSTANGSQATYDLYAKQSNGTQIRLQSSVIGVTGYNAAYIGTVTNHPLNFFTNNAAATPAMTILSGGNVGIGTTAPAGLLTVNKEQNYSYPIIGSTASNIHIRPGAGTDTYSTGISFGASSGYADNAEAGIYVQSSGGYGTKMYFATTNLYSSGSQARMMIDHLGNVGIGTTAPGAKLDVHGVISQNNTYKDSQTISFGTSSAGKWYKILSVPMGTAVTYDTSVYRIDIRYYAAAGINNGYSSQANVYIRNQGGVQTYYWNWQGSGGNLKLQAYPDSHTLELYAYSPSQWGMLQSSVEYSGENLATLTPALATSAIEITNSDQGVAVPYTGNFIVQQGNVGIGTTTPSEALSVTGNIKATGNIIAGGTMTANVSAPNVSAGTFGTTAGKGNYTFEAAANTNNVLKIDATNERVGIGTGSPGNKLHIYQGASGGTPYEATGGFTLETNGRAVLQILSASTSDQYIMFGDNNVSNRAWVGYNHATDLMSLHTGGNITMDGNVGIGTTTPAQKLQVEGNIRIGSNKLMLGGGNADSYIQHDGSGLITFAQSNWGGDFKFRAADSGGTAYDRLFIEGSNGNVGIGTIVPSARLEVYGGGATSTSNYRNIMIGNAPIATVSDAASYGAAISISRPSSNYNDSEIFTYLASSGALNMGLKARSDFVFVSGNSNTDVMRILANGNVGIGTTTPGSYKLYVAGGAKFDNPIEIGSPTADNHATTKSYVDSLLGTGGSGTSTASFGTIYVSGTSTLAATGGRVNIGANLPAVPSKVNIDGSLQIIGTMSATAFYDYDNTSYYINPNSSNIGFKTLGSVQSDGAIDNNYFMANTLIGTTTNPGTYKFVVAGSSYFSGTSQFNNQVTMNANLNLGANNISMTGNIGNVTKLTVTTIDPLYEIDGKKYATFASSIAGGVKEEFVGRGTLAKISNSQCSISNQTSNTNDPIDTSLKTENCKLQNYVYIIDFNKVERSSDLWVWYQAVDFSRDNVEVMATAYGVPVAIAYEIKEKKIIFRAMMNDEFRMTNEENGTESTISNEILRSAQNNEEGIEFSFRLVGKRHDWKDWSTYIKNQNEKPSFILKSK